MSKAVAGVGSDDAVPVELIEALSAIGERLEVEIVSAREVSQRMHLVVDVDLDLSRSGRCQLELGGKQCVACRPDAPELGEGLRCELESVAVRCYCPRRSRRSAVDENADHSLRLGEHDSGEVSFVSDRAQIGVVQPGPRPHTYRDSHPARV